MQRLSTYRRAMIDAVWPTAGLMREAALIALGGLFVAVAAQVQIKLPLSPVPVTGQTFAVLLLGALYGSRRGPAAVVAYLLLGAAGLPVFAGGAVGAVRLIGPTGGYLAGFVAAAFAVGLLSERGWDRRPRSAVAIMALGSAAIYAAGVVWLARFVGWGAVFQTGVLPFVVGDVFKIVLAALLLPGAWKILRLRL